MATDFDCVRRDGAERGKDTDGNQQLWSLGEGHGYEARIVEGGGAGGFHDGPVKRQKRGGIADTAAQFSAGIQKW